MKNIFRYKNETTLQVPLKAGYDLKKNTYRIGLIISSRENSTKEKQPISANLDYR